MTTVSTTPGQGPAGDPELVAGVEVGEYRVEQLLGKGGFGTVYSGVHPLIGKQVAIKVLARKYSADEDVVSRFIAEARAVNQIRHRNIIDIFSFGQLPDGRHYYVMEHLDGEPLDLYLERSGPMPLAEAIPILRALARALDAAHSKGIAHRDLKPDNIFLAHDADGTMYPKLLDFGIAKLLAPDEDVRHRTNTGVPIGTPYYMSPEQCRGRDVDHRTDIYSLGIVTYRVLTGTFPFDGDDYMELLVKQVNEEPPPPSSRRPELPRTVDEAIAWMMRKDRDARPQTAVEGIGALDPTAAETPAIPKRASAPITARATATADAFAVTTAQATGIPAKAPRSTLWIGSALVLVASAAGVFLIVGHTPPEAPAARPPASSSSPEPGNVLPPTPIASPPHDAAALATVAITIGKIAPHAHAHIGDTNVDVPGTFELQRGDVPVAVRFEAEGYQAKTMQIVPDHAQTIDVTLAHEPPKSHAPHHDTPPADHGDIIHIDFGNK